MFIGLAHVGVRVTDLERSLAFYSGLMGFKEKFRLCDENGNPWLVSLAIKGNTYFELLPNTDKEHTPAECSCVNHVGFETDNIHELYELLVANNVPVRGKPELVLETIWQFWCEDPDGNPLEFHQFPE